MPNSFSSRRLTSVQSAASPICSGTIWLTEFDPRQAGGVEASFQGLCTLEQLRATGVILADVADAGKGGGGNHRRQGRGKDETGGGRANEVHDFRIAGDIASVAPKRLRQSALDDVDAIGDPVTFGHASAVRAIHANRVDLIQVGHRVVLVREVADFADWRDVCVH